jgi:uncharacterized membrane protein YdbT with pleckstrin-like domain
MEEQKEIHNQHLTFAVRQSRYILFSNLILITLMFLLVLIFLIFGINFINNLLGNILPAATIITLAIIIFIIINAIFALKIILDWSTTFYIIRPREFVVHKGIIYKRKEKVELNQVEKIDITQGFIGRIMNYGTISIVNPVSENTERIYNIPDPYKYEKVLLQPSDTHISDPIKYIPPMHDKPSVTQ